MGYWVDSIVSNIFSIWVGSLFVYLIIGWPFEKLAPKYAESLGYATKTVSIIAIVIALDLWIMTLGPSSLTVDAVGLKLIAGVLIAGSKIFGRTRNVGIYECEECGHGHDLSKNSDQPLREGNRFSCTNCGAQMSRESFCVAIGPLPNTCQHRGYCGIRSERELGNHPVALWNYLGVVHCGER